MTAIVSQFEELEPNQGELGTTSTTLINRGKKFPGHPIAVVSSVHSIAQTPVKHLSGGAKSYYLPQRLRSCANTSLTPYPYQLRTIEEPIEEFDTDDITVPTLVRPISGHKIGFVQASARVRSGKFLTPSTDLLSKNLPHSQPQLQEFETDEVEIDEEEPFWRGVFVLPRSTKVLFSKEVEIKRNEVPTWKPCVVIDSYSLEDDKLLLGSSCELVFLWE